MFVLGEDSKVIKINFKKNGITTKEIITVAIRETFADVTNRLYSLQLLVSRDLAGFFFTARDKEIEHNIHEIRSTLANIIAKRAKN